MREQSKAKGGDTEDTEDTEKIAEANKETHQTKLEAALGIRHLDFEDKCSNLENSLKTHLEYDTNTTFFDELRQEYDSWKHAKEKLLRSLSEFIEFKPGKDEDKEDALKDRAEITERSKRMTVRVRNATSTYVAKAQETERNNKRMNQQDQRDVRALERKQRREQDYNEKMAKNWQEKRNIERSRQKELDETDDEQETRGRTKHKTKINPEQGWQSQDSSEPYRNTYSPPIGKSHHRSET